MTEQQTENQTANQTDKQAEGGPQDEITALRQQLAEAEQRAEDNNSKFLRARADMENYRKRIERTYADLSRSSKKDLLKKLLAVKDNLERALRYGEGNAGQAEGIVEGVRLTEYQLNQLLEQEGVQKIEAQGKPFDPRDEEAVQTVHDPNLPDHHVTHVVREGYVYDGEVLRPAQVIVNVTSNDDA